VAGENLWVQSKDVAAVEGSEAKIICYKIERFSYGQGIPFLSFFIVTITKIWSFSSLCISHLKSLGLAADNVY